MDKFDIRLKSIPNSIWQKISKIDHLQGQWIAGAKLSPQALGRLKRSVLVTSTGSSTRIEGAKLSDEEIEKLMAELRTQKFADRDSQEARGYYELLERVFDTWKTLKLGENSIKHFHKELLKYVEKDESHRGEYKKQENKVEMFDASGRAIAVLFDTTPPYLTPKETQELVGWTNDALRDKTYHPLLVMGHFLVSFLKIHPFKDGNGRLSRVLTNLLMLQTGYEYVQYVSHEKLVEDNKPEYYVALRKSQTTFGTEKETIIPWLEFFLDIVLKQSEMALDLLSKENIEKLLTKKQLAVWTHVQSVDGATPGEIAEATGVAQPTVRQALAKLLKLKKIERLGQGRSTRYKKIQ
jgi:Fic family protein|tara:strand:+ start:804 stop:1859 length:1056 start_codon:yes stop_codon:yes gene_type:complete